jgi:hypothetical protein
MMKPFSQPHPNDSPERRARLYYLSPMCRDPTQKAEPAPHFNSVSRQFRDKCVFTPASAESIAPPTMPHESEASPAMIANSRLLHHTLPLHFEKISSFQ